MTPSTATTVPRESPITAESKTLAFVRALPATGVIAASIGIVAFDGVPVLRGLSILVAVFAFMVMLPKTNPWRSHLLDEARFQGDYLWMRRGKDVLAVPLRYIGSVAVEGGFLSFRHVRLVMTDTCSLGSTITLVPKSWPGDSSDRCVVAEQLEQRVRMASRPKAGSSGHAGPGTP